MFCLTNNYVQMTLPVTSTLRSKGVLFGLNYAYDSGATLNGCINDVNSMATFLKSTWGIPCQVYTDDVAKVECSGNGIIQRLYQLACESYSENLDLVWIHYSGHGSYVRDSNSDEKDGQDECLVPSDFRTAGLVPDDYICQLFKCFNPKTRVISVFDCCHSGTIGDVKYSWEGPRLVNIENIVCVVPAKVITLSGCLDTQTSADAFNVLGDNRYIGALTACLLMTLQKNTDARKNVFVMVEQVRKALAVRGFTQRAKLCSSHNLALDPVFVPGA